jgi:hypothetical protein
MMQKAKLRFVAVGNDYLKLSWREGRKQVSWLGAK